VIVEALIIGATELHAMRVREQQLAAIAQVFMVPRAARPVDRPRCPYCAGGNADGETCIGCGARLGARPTTREN
jgi:hypothetical protein